FSTLPTPQITDIFSMTVTFGIILGSYCLFVLILIAGWRRMERSVVKGTGKLKLGISVVIACRNEADNVEALIESLSKLEYPKESFEVIFVDDHSTDDTVTKIKSGISGHFNFFLISNESALHGKKQALQSGIAMARYDCMATTDADCIVPTDWLSYISLFFENDNLQMLIGGVLQKRGNSLFARLQRMEFSSLIGVAAASLGWGRAVLGNAANLAFRKTAFLEVNGYKGNLHIASGDDEFLIRKVAARFPGGISFMNFSESWVSTLPMESVKDFFNQRLRWAGKWRHNTDPMSKVLAVYILTVQWVWLLLLVRIFWNPDSLLIIAVIKVLAEAIYFFHINRFQRTGFDGVTFLLLQIIYPFYVIFTGLFSLTGTFRWKDRKYK
ncbi:MAG TPA: glycosyltransferase, partial [Cyclobacteriaceae bacterium]|nr:glycosyltransferase [Cyclobacteriaceae bacterium]